MTAPLRLLARDERGASLIEMGMAMPVLAFVFMGVVDVSRGYAAKLQLEQSAQRALEKVQQAGYNHSTTTPNDLTALEDDAELAAGAGSSATATAYLECRSGATVTTTAYNGTCASGATKARYVSVSITKNYATTFGSVVGSNTNGSFTLTGEAAIRTQ